MLKDNLYTLNQNIFLGTYESRSLVHANYNKVLFLDKIFFYLATCDQYWQYVYMCDAKSLLIYVLITYLSYTL